MSVPSTNEDFDACFEPDAPTTLSYEWFSIQIQITCAYTAGGEPSDPQSAVEPAGDAAAASAPVTIAAAANAATTARRIVRGTTVRTVTDRLGPCTTPGRTAISVDDCEAQAASIGAPSSRWGEGGSSRTTRPKRPRTTTRRSSRTVRARGSARWRRIVAGLRGLMW